MTECGLTELPIDQCACPRHRGGTVAGQVDTDGPTFEAAYAGRCEGCERGITPGQTIARATDGGYVHAACGRDA